MALQSFEKMQEEIYQWSLYNFGEQGAYRPLLGIFEEIEECADARDRIDREGIRDAVGDICVYMMNYCAIRNWEFLELMDDRCAAPSGIIQGNDISIVGKLSHHHLKAEQGIRGKAEAHDFAIKVILKHLLWKLDELCLECSIFMHQAVHDTWSKVKMRDWRKNSYDGSVPRPAWLSPLDNLVACIRADIDTDVMGVVSTEPVPLTYDSCLQFLDPTAACSEVSK